jgi:SAM-dependent methyltransferase
VAAYFSTFIPGLSELVLRRLGNDLADFTVTELLDGLVAFETSSVSQKVAALTYFNNSFELLFRSTNSDLQDFMREVIQADISFPPVRRQSFRVIFSNENQLSSAPTSLWIKLEKKIGKATRQDTDRTTPDAEYWLLRRNDDKCFFGKRITRHADYATILGKGELRPEMTSFMVFLSEPNKTDIVLDPCAGSGGIVKGRLLTTVGKMIVGDTDTQIISALRKKFPGVEIKKLDVCKMPEVPSGSVDKVITDPPWGNFDVKKGSVELFYALMFNEVFRVLKPGGIFVLLTAQKDISDQEILKHSFTLSESHDILVSGKKARLYKLIKQ